MDNLSEVSVVIPSKSESHEVLDFLYQELTDLGAEVIIVEDGSEFPYKNFAISHTYSQGYGQSIMDGIEFAHRPLILTMDGDGQHRVQDVINLCQVWNMLDVEMVIGARRLQYEEPLRMWGRKTLNLIASIFTGIYMNDLNSGLRIFKKDIATSYLPILCKTFSFTTSLTMSFMTDKRKVEWFPVKVKEREHGKSHVNVMKDGWVTLKYILWIGMALRTRKIRAWLRRHPWWMKLTKKS